MYIIDPNELNFLQGDKCHTNFAQDNPTKDTE